MYSCQLPRMPELEFHLRQLALRLDVVAFPADGFPEGRPRLEEKLALLGLAQRVVVPPPLAPRIAQGQIVFGLVGLLGGQKVVVDGLGVFALFQLLLVVLCQLVRVQRLQGDDGGYSKQHQQRPDRSQQNHEPLIQLSSSCHDLFSLPVDSLRST